ncbi:MAG: TIGR04282 family arsenosugar biosynthesis glycosyltransferase [Dehalococcoidia bacterium]
MAGHSSGEDDVIEAYAARFTAGLLDLSCPSPPFASQIDVGARPVDPAFPTAGGSRALRERIARLYERLDADDILVTSGASEALAALAAALARPGTPVAVADGAYPSFATMARLAGASITGGDEVEGASALLTSNPTVPGGRRVDIEGVIERAVAAGAVPVVDEVYRHIALEGEPPAAAADLHEAAVSVGDVSKTMGLGGLRIGWIATRNAEVRAAAVRWLRLLTGGPSVLSEAAACEAFETFDAQVARHMQRARTNAPRVYRALREAGWTFEPAELGLTVCASPSEPVDDTALQRLRAHGSFLLPADSFGRAGCFRVGLLTPEERLRDALADLGGNAGRCVVVLGRTPERGRGKTRLAASLGEERTHELAQAFFDDSCALGRSEEWAGLLAYDGARPAVSGLDAVAQAGGALGERIVHGLECALERGERAVLIGTDTPDLPRAYLERAFAELDEADAVLGPSVDGGFYLIGVRATAAGMFDGVEWSTPRVFARTLANLERLGWRVAVLPEWEDIDDLGSLMRLAARLDASDGYIAPETRRVLAHTLDG